MNNNNKKNLNFFLKKTEGRHTTGALPVVLSLAPTRCGREIEEGRQKADPLSFFCKKNRGPAPCRPPLSNHP